MKMIVAVLLALEIAQVVISSYDAFRMFAHGWNDLRQLDDVGLLWFSVPIMNAISEPLSRTCTTTSLHYHL